MQEDGLVKTYHRPTGVDEALKLLADSNDKNTALAGGTSLALNPRGIDGLVDLAGLGLSYIRPDGAVLRIGAMTAVREIQRSEDIRQFADGILAESAKNYLTALIRNRATIGGVLSAGNFWADIAVVLVALGASVKIAAGANGRAKESVVSVEDFIQKGPRKSLSGGIVTEIEIPAPESNGRCAYSRLAKVETDISILSCAVKAEVAGKTIKTARLVVGNGARPVRLKIAEEKMRGHTLTAAAETAALSAREIPAESDIRASADYRREVAGVLAKRTVQYLADLA